MIGKHTFSKQIVSLNGPDNFLQENICFCNNWMFCHRPPSADVRNKTVLKTTLHPDHAVHPGVWKPRGPQPTYQAKDKDSETGRDYVGGRNGKSDVLKFVNYESMSAQSCGFQWNCDDWKTSFFSGNSVFLIAQIISYEKIVDISARMECVSKVE